MRRFDHPTELAVLRMMARDPLHWKGAEDIRKAVLWLDDPGHVLDGLVWRRVSAMEDANLLDRRRAVGVATGREWRLAEGVNVKRFTGGLDVLRLDRDEILQSGDDARRGNVAYTPSAYLVAGTGKAKAARAIKQCPSPWELGDRMTKIKWNNPELV
jgi:hypothetical protein